MRPNRRINSAQDTKANKHQGSNDDDIEEIFDLTNDEEEEEDVNENDESYRPDEEVLDGLSSEGRTDFPSKNRQSTSMHLKTTSQSNSVKKSEVAIASEGMGDLTVREYIQKQKSAAVQDRNAQYAHSESDSSSSVQIISCSDEETNQIQQDQANKKRQNNIFRILKDLQFSNPGSQMATPEMGIYQFNEEEGKGAAERPRRTTRKQLLENEYSKRVTRHLSHNQKGHLLTPNGKSVDICDCLKRECPGCNFPCRKCGSRKCSYACRVGRRTFIESIEILGRDVIENPYLR